MGEENNNEPVVAPKAPAPHAAAPVKAPSKAAVAAPVRHDGPGGASALTDLGQRYAQQFSTTIETLRKRAVEVQDDFAKGQSPLQQYVAQAQQIAQDPNTLQRIKEAATDATPVPATVGASGQSTFKFILETYAWAAVCLVAASIGGILGGYLLSPLLTLALSTLATVALAYVALPYYAGKFIVARNAQADDVETRMYLLAASFAIGLLNGHNLSSSYLYAMTPPSFLLPALIAVAAEMAGPQLADNRPAFIGACVGPAAGAYLVLGLLSGSIGLAYLLFVIVMCAVAAGTLQYTLAACKSGEANAYVTQLVVIVGLVAAKAFLTLLLSTDKEGYQNYVNSQK